MQADEPAVPDDSDDSSPAEGVDPVFPDSATTAPPPRSDYHVPADADPATCPACGRPFPDAERLALHRGLEHAAAHREAARSARDSESRRLRRYRLRALIVLIAVYFGLLLVSAFVI